MGGVRVWFCVCVCVFVLFCSCICCCGGIFVGMLIEGCLVILIRYFI